MRKLKIGDLVYFSDNTFGLNKEEFFGIVMHVHEDDGSGNVFWISRITRKPVGLNKSAYFLGENVERFSEE